MCHRRRSRIFWTYASFKELHLARLAEENSTNTSMFSKIQTFSDQEPPKLGVHLLPETLRISVEFARYLCY